MSLDDRPENEKGRQEDQGGNWQGHAGGPALENKEEVEANAAENLPTWGLSLFCLLDNSAYQKEEL